MEYLQYEMEDLVPIVAKLAQKYAGWESTSIPYEKAQQLMDAVLYCINESPGASEHALRYEPLTAEDAYQKGLQIVTSKVLDTKEHYHQVLSSFESYGNCCLYDTVVKGIPEFFKWYDIKYNPQNTILTLDYPTLTDLHTFTGIDAIQLFIEDISLEQQFLNQLDTTYIISILDTYSGSYKELVENIIHIVLPSILGHLLLKKPFTDRGFTSQDCHALSGIFSSRTTEEINQLLTSLTQGFLTAFYKEIPSLPAYLNKSIYNLTPRIINALENSHIHTLFLV